MGESALDEFVVEFFLGREKSWPPAGFGRFSDPKLEDAIPLGCWKFLMPIMALPLLPLLLLLPWLPLLPLLLWLLRLLWPIVSLVAEDPTVEGLPEGWGVPKMHLVLAEVHRWQTADDSSLTHLSFCARHLSQAKRLTCSGHVTLVEFEWFIPVGFWGSVLSKESA